MSLIVENGSVVAGAESYVSVGDFRAFAARRGVSVPVADATCEILLIKASDYLNTLEERFKGKRVRYDQALAWPRYDVSINGYDWRSDRIPQQLKDAQLALAIEAQTNDLMPTRLPGESGAVTVEKIGSLQVEYAQPVNASAMPRFPKVDGFLARLLNGSAINVRLVRA